MSRRVEWLLELWTGECRWYRSFDSAIGPLNKVSGDYLYHSVDKVHWGYNLYCWDSGDKHAKVWISWRITDRPL